MVARAARGNHRRATTHPCLYQRGLAANRKPPGAVVRRRSRLARPEEWAGSLGCRITFYTVQSDRPVPGACPEIVRVSVAQKAGHCATDDGQARGGVDDFRAVESYARHRAGQ